MPGAASSAMAASAAIVTRGLSGASVRAMPHSASATTATCHDLQSLQPARVGLIAERLHAIGEQDERCG